MKSGHVLVGTDGRIREADSAFCAIVKGSSDTVRGRLVLDVTAPGDRDECARAIERLRQTGEPFVITKRFLREDGTLVWVKNTVSLMHGGQEPLIVATIEPIEDRSADRSPAALADIARYLIASHDARAEVCDPDLLSGAAWSTILVAYVAEAEGRPVDVPTLVEMLGIPQSVVERWLKALTRSDMLEVEVRHPAAETPKSYRLTSLAQDRLEAYLIKVDRLKADGRATDGAIEVVASDNDEAATLISEGGATLVSFARALVALDRKIAAFDATGLLRLAERIILVALFLAEHDDRPFGLADACLVAAMPSTAALMAVERLRTEGIVDRRGDARDGRREILRLTHEGRQLCIDYMRLLSPNQLL